MKHSSFGWFWVPMLHVLVYVIVLSLFCLVYSPLLLFKIPPFLLVWFHPPLWLYAPPWLPSPVVCLCWYLVPVFPLLVASSSCLPPHIASQTFLFRENLLEIFVTDHLLLPFDQPLPWLRWLPTRVPNSLSCLPPVGFVCCLWLVTCTCSLLHKQRLWLCLDPVSVVLLSPNPCGVCPGPDNSK